MGCTGLGREYHRSFGLLNSPECGEEDRMTTCGAELAEEWHRLATLKGSPAGSRIMPAEPGSWWLVMLGLAGHAAQVATADRERVALLATASHDLRAPLAAAKAAVSGLRANDGRLTTDDRADLLAAAEDALDRLARLTASLLDVSRLQVGARAVFPQPVHMGEIVTAALEALGPQPKPVLADIPSRLPEVMTDPVIAERVIVNLAGNALRYSLAAAPPRLIARAAGNRVELRVVDHGPGIPAAKQERVFQPFCRLGTAGDRTGVGLGLAVARGLAETLGGTVEPEDTPGGGLTMVLTLPSAPRPSGTPSSGCRPRDEPGVSGRGEHQRRSSTPPSKAAAGSPLGR
jgi:two-component system, OmpR family, sensor histidine kinase KdpD